MIKVQDLTFAYENTDSRNPSLKDINLFIGEGEYVALIGPNGCGKTTLIRQFNGLLLPTTGEVLINGLSTRNPRNLVEIRQQVGMIFQNPDHQIVGMSVEEDVAFGPGNLGLPPVEVRRRVDCSLETVGLTGLQKRAPHTLSGGQKQLLALAGILAMEPRIIILDESTSSLDPAGKKSILALLQKLKALGMGIIYVTHNMEEAALADRVLVMDRGELAADGTPHQVLARVDWLKSLGLAPPRISELFWRLRERGADVSPAVFNLDEAVEEIDDWLERCRKSSHTGAGGEVEGHG